MCQITLSSSVFSSKLIYIVSSIHNITTLKITWKNRNNHSITYPIQFYLQATATWRRQTCSAASSWCSTPSSASPWTVSCSPSSASSSARCSSPLCASTSPTSRTRTSTRKSRSPRWRNDAPVWQCRSSCISYRDSWCSSSSRRSCFRTTRDGRTTRRCITRSLLSRPLGSEITWQVGYLMFIILWG